MVLKNEKFIFRIFYYFVIDYAHRRFSGTIPAINENNFVTIKRKI